VIHVRRHKRETASGKTVSVRAHDRDGGDGVREAPEWAQPVSVSDFGRPAESEPEPGAGDWWADSESSDTDEPPAYDYTLMDDAWSETWRIGDRADPSARQEPGDSALARMQDEMREWRSRPEPVPPPDEPMSPQMAKLLGCDTPEGRAKYDRLRAYRGAGYTGPLDQDNRIPDPDDPANRQSLSALAALREL
jgi:hypothetical protein